MDPLVVVVAPELLAQRVLSLSVFPLLDKCLYQPQRRLSRLFAVLRQLGGGIGCLFHSAAHGQWVGGSQTPGAILPQSEYQCDVWVFPGGNAIGNGFEHFYFAGLLRPVPKAA